MARISVNHPNRVVTFDYDPQGRIERIRDYTGRSWHYTYDDLSDLVAFTLPATAQYPAGSTVYYEYTSGAFAGNLQHNLARIIDPVGRVYVENEYGADEGLVNYNKVVRQRLGAGESSFDYEQVVNAFEYSYSDAEAPWRQVNFVERNGHPIHYIYNKFGNLVLKEEYILERGRRRLLQWRYRYNSDGALIGMLSPEGSVTQYYYGRDHYLRAHGIGDDEVSQHSALMAQERLAFDNLLAMVRRGKRYTFETMNLSRGVWGDFFPDVLATDPEDVVTKFTYEPSYQQILTASDPRFTNSADPRHLERTSSSYFVTLTQHEYSGPSGDPHRFLARIRYPATTQADGTVLPGSAEQFTKYDPRGRLQRQIDRAGVVTETTHFSASDGIKEGYVKKQIVDPGGLAVTTEFEVNDLGVVTAIHHPRSVGTAGGRFVTRFELNERNQIVRTHASPPFDYVTESLYDPSGLVVRMERDILDETGRPILGGKEVQTFCYEEQKQVIRHSMGGIDLTSHHATRHRYDAAANLTATFTPAGGVVRRRYDDRLLQRAIVRGSGFPDAATSRAEFDGDGRRSRALSGRGMPTTFGYDALGRIELLEDALGNRTYLTHDKAGNITRERVFERRADGGYSLLSRGEYAYDELSRLIREGHDLFQQPIPVGNPRTAYLVSPGPLIQTKYYYDAKGRLVRTVNAKGQSSHARFDALDRKCAEWDDLGNRVETQYDAHGNATRRDVIETLIDPASGQTTGTEVFPTAYQYDELERLITVTDSLGNATRHAYDSRNNLVRTTDPLGNVVRYEYDVYNRQVSELRDLTDTGLGNGAAAGTIQTQFEYDGNGNLTAHVDGNGNRIEQRFDALDRRTTVIYPDTTEYQTDYDEDDNIVLTEDNNGTIRRAEFDALGRRTRVDVDRSGVMAGLVVEGENCERYTYDALGRPLSEVNDFATMNRKVDSLGRVFSESIEVTSPAPTSPVRAIARTHDELGAIQHLVYPDNRTIQYDRDALNRVVRVVNVAKGTAYPGSTLDSNLYNILQINYRGQRLETLHYGNGTRAGYQYDAVGRVIEIKHCDSGGLPILTLQHLYDGAGNMRFRNDITATGGTGERFEYDSIYRLTRIKPDAIATFNPALFAPATGRPIDPIPPRQATISARLGSMAQDAANATFAYDAAANRNREQRLGLPAVNYVPNALNEYQSVGSVVFSFDRNGNLVSDGTREYFYDSRNLLVRVADSATGADLARYFHDSLGRRIAEVRSGHAVHLVSDGLNVLEEYQDGTLRTQYVHEARTDAICQIAQAAKDYSLHKDVLGSTRLLSDETGAGAGGHKYDAFGALVADSVPFNRVCFAGRRFDREIGLYNFRARDFSPFLGRFIQRDPKGVGGGLNSYEYAWDNPLRFTDPLGTEPSEVTKAIHYFAGGTYGAMANFCGFLRLGLFDSVDQYFDEAAKERANAAGDWFQSLYGAVYEERFFEWLGEGWDQRWDAIDAAEARGDYAGAASVFGDTWMNIYFVGRGAYGLARGGVAMGSDIHAYGVVEASKGLGYQVRYWATTNDGLGVKPSSAVTYGVHRGSPYANYQTYMANRFITKTTALAERLIRSGDGNQFPRVLNYRNAIGTRMEAARYGSAVQQIVDNFLTRSSKALLSTDIIRGRAFGTNARGNALYPDYRLNIGNQTIIDITTLKQAGKVLKYAGGNLIEPYTGTVRYALGILQPPPMESD